MYRLSLLVNSLFVLDSHLLIPSDLLPDPAAPTVRVVGAALPQVAAGRGEMRVDLQKIGEERTMKLPSRFTRQGGAVSDHR